MSEKWTGTPWFVSGVRQKVEVSGVRTDSHIVMGETETGQEPICAIYYSPNYHAETWANAHLIASAPDLYWALKDIYEWMNGLPIPTTGCTRKMGEIAKVLAKARGESND